MANVLEIHAIRLGALCTADCVDDECSLTGIDAGGHAKSFLLFYILDITGLRQVRENDSVFDA